MTILLEAPRPGTSDPDGDESYYHVTTPDGQLKKHKRASTYTGLLDDNYALRRYHDRQLAHGLALRKDLAALARSHKIDERDVYHNTIIPQALAAAADGAKANIGTALHRNTEDLDRGAQLAALDPEWFAHLKAYRDTIAALPFQVVERYIEQVVICDGYQIAGTIDRVLVATRDLTVTFPNGRTVEITAGEMIVGDLKTGAWFTPLKWMIQCAIYAHATATWHPDPDHPHKGVRGPSIGVRADVALVIHLQAGDPAAPCELHWLDLEAGYDAFLTAYEIAGHRAAAKKAHVAYTDHLPTAIETQMAAWCRARLAVVGEHPDAKGCLLRQWPLRNPDDSIVRYGDHPTPEQTSALLALLDRIEAEYGLPFTPQPGTTSAPTQGQATNQQPSNAPKEQ